MVQYSIKKDTALSWKFQFAFPITDPEDQQQPRAHQQTFRAAPTALVATKTQWLPTGCQHLRFPVSSDLPACADASRGPANDCYPRPLTLFYTFACAQLFFPHLLDLIPLVFPKRGSAFTTKTWMTQSVFHFCLWKSLCVLSFDKIYRLVFTHYIGKCIVSLNTYNNSER